MMRIDNIIEGIGKVVGAIDSRLDVKRWAFCIYEVNSVPSEAVIQVESNIQCLIDLIKVLVTSISRVEFVGQMPSLANYNADDIFVLGLIPVG